MTVLYGYNSQKALSKVVRLSEKTVSCILANATWCNVEFSLITWFINSSVKRRVCSDRCWTKHAEFIFLPTIFGDCPTLCLCINVVSLHSRLAWEFYVLFPRPSIPVYNFPVLLLRGTKVRKKINVRHSTLVKKGIKIKKWYFSFRLNYSQNQR